MQCICTYLIYDINSVFVIDTKDNRDECPRRQFLYIEYTMKIGQYILDIQYV